LRQLPMDARFLPFTLHQPPRDATEPLSCSYPISSDARQRRFPRISFRRIRRRLGPSCIKSHLMRRRGVMPRVKSRLMRQRDFGRCINSSPARRRRFISCIKSYPLRRTSQVGGINLRPMRGEAYFPCIAPNLRQRRPRLPRIKSGRTPQPVRFPRSGSDLTQESLCLRRIKLVSTRRIAGFARIEP
jgi:hypothetical protein